MATLTVSADNEKRVKAMGFLSNKGTDNFPGVLLRSMEKYPPSRWNVSPRQLNFTETA